MAAIGCQPQGAGISCIMDAMEVYTDSQLDTGRWVRDITAHGKRGIKSFYDSPEWRKKRRAVLKAAHYECANCLYKYGRYGRATTVHHIKHLDQYPELALTDSNLMPLCSACHNEMHPEKQYKQREHKERWTNEERW